jgi:FKBP-type peptidyl-prolyl cis-trans isomerase SlyD
MYRPVVMAQTLLKLEYEIRTKNGDVLESSSARGPLEFVPGRRRLLPALEHVIARLHVGEEASGELEAARAFGDESVLPEMEILRSEFPEGETPEVGRKYEAKTADGSVVRFRVLSGDDKVVGVKLLHPLADADLEYRFKLLAVEDPSVPPPMPARAIGIESSAIQILEERAEG